MSGRCAADDHQEACRQRGVNAVSYPSIPTIAGLIAIAAAIPLSSRTPPGVVPGTPEVAASQVSTVAGADGTAGSASATPTRREVPRLPSKSADPVAVVAEVPLPTPAPRRVVAIRNTESGPRIEVVKAPDAPAAEATVAALQRDPTVAGVNIDTPVRATVDFSSQQWALPALNATTTWAKSTGAGVRVAVVDTGVQGSHPDLQGRVLSGAEFLGGTGQATGGNGQNDQNGHGTHVAGIVGANRDGNLVTGIAPGASIMPVRVLDGNGAGWNSDVDAGIIWAADNGADVINLSLGGNSSSSTDAAAIAYAANTRHVAIFAAAGNGGPTAGPSYPAAYPGAIGVSATDSSNTIASFSNRGSYVSLAAPGVSILSDFPTSTVATMSGTSMATPYASGSAADALSALRTTSPRATGRDIVDVLQQSATDLGVAGRDTSYGFGLVNPAAAVNRVTAPSPTPTTPTPTTPTPKPVPAPTAPSAPRAVIVTAATRSLSVRFSAPVNAGSRPITKYQVLCTSASRSVSATGNANLRSATFTGLSQPGSFRCSVRAGNGLWGPWTSPVAPAAARR